MGKRKQLRHVPPVGWRDVSRFSISAVARERGPWGRPVIGSVAVRVPMELDGGTVNAPCAFLGNRDVYEDEALQRVLCRVEGDEPNLIVRDGEGTSIGEIRRVPPTRLIFAHTWRIDQPGHPEIVGRNKWATLTTKDAIARGAGKLLGAAADAVLSFGAEGGDQPTDRTLLWLAGEEQVMESAGQSFSITADWLDRRLAFAFALLRDR